MRTLRLALAVVALLFVVQWARPAQADTITGTVGAIGILMGNGNGIGQANFRFKLTDLNQTKACTGAGNTSVAVGPGYAWFYGASVSGSNADPPSREWYAALLVSKKGATIVCTMTAAPDCHITSCELP